MGLIIPTMPYWMNACLPAVRTKCSKPGCSQGLPNRRILNGQHFLVSRGTERFVAQYPLILTWKGRLKFVGKLPRKNLCNLPYSWISHQHGGPNISLPKGDARSLYLPERANTHTSVLFTSCAPRNRQGLGGRKPKKDLKDLSPQACEQSWIPREPS